jgi:F-box interacting protein
LKDKGCLNIVGSCNGLICLAGNSGGDFMGEYRGFWFCIWNPATRTTSDKFGYFCDPKYPPNYNFKFGCDNSTDTYKVVASSYNLEQSRRNVRTLSMGNNVWRDIESFPFNPLYLDNSEHQSFASVGVYLSDTLNWLAIHNDFLYDNSKSITVEPYVIVSLNLGTETYRQYMLPRLFDKVWSREPNIGVCGGCLCFSYSYNKTYFSTWRMKKFGIGESWTQFLKINYLQLDFDISIDTIKYIQLVPCLLSENNDTLILESNEGQGYKAILYNWKDDRAKRTGISAIRSINNRATDRICWYLITCFVESLVSIC